MEEFERETGIMIHSLDGLSHRLHSLNVARFPELVENIQVKLDAALVGEAEANQRIREHNCAFQQLQGMEWAILN